MSLDSSKVRSIFTAAVENHAPDRWAEVLDEACGEDAELRRRVEALLRAHQGEDSFLDRGNGEGPPVATLEQPLPEKPGTLIGPYRLLEQIGEGGMGVVYAAEQAEPVRRRVALKIIKPGMDSRQVIARFEAEKQALSLMDHPNIAKVLDAGTTEGGARGQGLGARETEQSDSLGASASSALSPDPYPLTPLGRPYFVMELVKGIPITLYCDQRRLTLRQRLELFVPVCNALQHAHQKGIIHRDIKPSNVLVAECDQRPVPKVIDFGVARAIGQRLRERTVFTALGEVVGTLDYMSPEQARLNQLDIDTRSDIYSLGVLLYELLTGETPFDRRRLRAAAFDERLRIIREEEPPRPSSRSRRLSRSCLPGGTPVGDTSTTPGKEGRSNLPPAGKGDGSNLCEAPAGPFRQIGPVPFSGGEAGPTRPESSPAAISAARKTDPIRLTRLLRRDLDWIVMKALQKDRSRRYPTADDFARDIQRYLSHEPIEARPPSLADRVAKWMRRHRPLVVSVAVLLVLSTLGSLVANVLIAREQRRAAEAYKEKNRQLAATQRAEELAKQQERLAKEQERLAKEQHRLAEVEKEEVVKQRDRSERNLYIAHMRLAQHDWEQGQIARLQEMLDRHIPRPGTPDLRGWEWYYLLSLCHSDLMTLRGHKGSVRSVAWSPDGKWIASGGEDKTIRIWDAATGREVRTLVGHQGTVLSLAWSPDGNRLASGSADGTARVWDMTTGKEGFLFRVPAVPADVFIYSVDWSPDGHRFAIGGSGGSSGQVIRTPNEDPRLLRVFDASNGREVLNLDGEARDPVAWSADGKRLASGGIGWWEFRTWDPATGRRLLAVKHDVSYGIAWSRDGKRLATAEWPNTAGIWDAATGRRLLDLRHPGIVSAVAWNSDGSRLATASWAQRITVWNARTGDEVSRLLGHRGRVRSVAWSPDGTRLVSSGDDGTVKIWDALASGDATTLERIGAADLAWSPRGDRVASAGGGKVRIWNSATGAQLKSFDVPAQTVTWSPNGDRLALVISETRVAVLDPETGTQRDASVPGGSLIWSPDVTRLVIRDFSNNTVRVWDTVKQREIVVRHGPAEDGVAAACWSPDGSRVASGGRHGGAVWDACTGKDLFALKARGLITSFAWSAHGNRLALGRSTGEIEICDATTGREMRTLVGHTGASYAMRWSPDGRRLASGSIDGLARVWDPETGDDLYSMPGSSVAWSPDGHRLATIGDSRVRIYDASIGYALARAGARESQARRSSEKGEKPPTAKEKRKAK